jgi:type VI secretion system Hcp family effector
VGVDLETLAYMYVKSSVQGVFQDDESRAGTDRTVCWAVRFRGEVPHDVRKGSGHSVTQHEPISVIREWSASTAQFLTAMWTNEVLEQVSFEFVRPNTDGKEEVYATLTLSKVTVAFVELRSGNTAALLDSAPRAAEHLGFHAQAIEFKVTGSAGSTTATYKRPSSTS